MLNSIPIIIIGNILSFQQDKKIDKDLQKITQQLL